MSKFEIFDSSDAVTVEKKIGAEKYPWLQLPVGKSFFIRKSEHPVKIATIRTSCSRWSKKLGRHFRAVEHAEGIEVARLPDPSYFEKNAPVASSANPRPIPAATIRQPEDDPLSWLNKPRTDQPAATVHAGWPDPYKSVEDKPSVGTEPRHPVWGQHSENDK